MSTPGRSGSFRQSEDAYCLEDPQSPECVGIRRVLRGLERDGHVALRSEVVDFVGLHLLDDPDQVRRVRHVAEVELEAHVLLVRVVIQVIDPIRVEQRRASLDAMDFVSLLQQELCEISAVLPSDAGD